MCIEFLTKFFTLHNTPNSFANTSFDKAYYAVINVVVTIAIYDFYAINCLC